MLNDNLLNTLLRSPMSEGRESEVSQHGEGGDNTFPIMVGGQPTEPTVTEGVQLPPLYHLDKTVGELADPQLVLHFFWAEALEHAFKGEAIKLDQNSTLAIVRAFHLMNASSTELVQLDGCEFFCDLFWYVESYAVGSSVVGWEEDEYDSTSHSNTEITHAKAWPKASRDKALLAWKQHVYKHAVFELRYTTSEALKAFAYSALRSQAFVSSSIFGDDSVWMINLGLKDYMIVGRDIGEQYRNGVNVAERAVQCLKDLVNTKSHMAEF